MFEIKPKLTKENILNRVRDSEIFNFYCPHFNKGFFPGEFRIGESDNHPSANIFLGRDGRWRYSDFGEAGTYDCFAYVQRKFNLGFKEALDKINMDMNLGLGGLNNNSPSSYSNFHPIKPKLSTSTTSLSETIIKVKKRQYESRDKDYWYGKYYIPQKLFEYHNNFAIKTYWIFNNKETYPISPKDITYTQNYYKDSTGIYRRKIYRPLSDYKWTSNITGLVVQGIKHLPKYGDILIITKSMKDLLVLKVLDFKAVIATNNETSWIPDKVRLDLESRFKNIFINFDNDATGLEMGNYIASQYGYTPIFTEDYDYKDPSDMIEKYGIKYCKEFFEELIYAE